MDPLPSRVCLQTVDNQGSLQVIDQSRMSLQIIDQSRVSLQTIDNQESLQIIDQSRVSLQIADNQGSSDFLPIRGEFSDFDLSGVSF
jgi:hypothetical protein